MNADTRAKNDDICRRIDNLTERLDTQINILDHILKQSIKCTTKLSSAK